MQYGLLREYLSYDINFDVVDDIETFSTISKSDKIKKTRRGQKADEFNSRFVNNREKR